MDKTYNINDEVVVTIDDLSYVGKIADIYEISCNELNYKDIAYKVVLNVGGFIFTDCDHINQDKEVVETFK